MTRHPFSSTLIAAGALMAAAPAAAAAEPDAGGWIVDLGARVGGSPSYEGSDKTKVTVSPTLAIRRANPVHRFTPPDPGATLALISSRRFTVGPTVLFRRSRKDTGELTGLRRVKRAAEVGGFVDIWPADWLRLHLEGRRGIVGHKGWLGDAGFDLVYSGARIDASIGPRVGYASDRYMQTYFGVTPEEAARNPALVAYLPSGGARSVGGRAALAYYFSDQWRAGVDVGYQRLGHRAADSPIVRAFGSRDQVSAGVSLAYSFGLPFGRR